MERLDLGLGDLYPIHARVLGNNRSRFVDHVHRVYTGNARLNKRVDDRHRVLGHDRGRAAGVGRRRL